MCFFFRVRIHLKYSKALTTKRDQVDHLVSIRSMSLTLLLLDPSDDLVLIEDNPTVGLESEMWKTSRDKGLPNRPRRAPDEASCLPDA